MTLAAKTKRKGIRRHQDYFLALLPAAPKPRGRAAAIIDVGEGEH
jgi:hypothetical protein